jgi:hypothetical protein
MEASRLEHAVGVYCRPLAVATVIAAPARLCFPDGIAFDGKRFVGTRVTAPAFSYLRTIDGGNERMVTQIFTCWNPMISWLKNTEALARTA